MTINAEYQVGRFCWIDLAAHDLEEAAEFYQQLLGWSRERADLPEQCGEYEYLKHVGRPVAGVAQMSAASISGGDRSNWNSYVFVDDVDAAVRKATELGATVIRPPGDAAPLGRQALIQDPGGAVLGLCQQLPSDAAGTDITPPFWNELQTRDAEAARDFYRRLFGWQFEDRSAGGIICNFIRCGERQDGWLVQMDERWGDMPSRWAVYFVVDYADFAADQLRQLGGMVYVPPFDYPMGRTAMVGDVEGTMFNLVQTRRLGPIASDTQLAEGVDHAGDDAG